MLRSFVIFLYCIFCCVSLTHAYEAYELDNGLKVILLEDQRAPVAYCQVWYEVGASDEPDGQTGISHVLEHMMFQGSKNFPDTYYTDFVNGLGGSYNAATSADETYYYATIPPEGLETCLRIEADRMQHLSFTEDDFIRERGVVQEERRMRIDDKPLAKASEQFQFQLNQGTGYAHPIIGWMNEIGNLQQQQVYDWYQRWYVPNRATVIVGGDIDKQATKQWITDFFGVIPASKSTWAKQDRKARDLPKQQTVYVDTKIEVLMMGYKMPSWFTVSSEAEHQELVALSLLASVLSNGQSSRLSQALVYQQQIASSASARYSVLKEELSSFTFFVVPNEGVALETVQQAALDELKRLQTELVQPNELERIRNQALAQLIYQKDALASQINSLANYSNSGLDLDFDKQWIEKMKHVTPEMIREVANKYFVDKPLFSTFVKPPKE